MWECPSKTAFKGNHRFQFVLNVELGLALCLFTFFLLLFHPAMEKKKSRFSV